MALLVPLEDYREIARQCKGTTACGAILGLINEVQTLRRALIKGPCTQNSIPCSWPCDSEIPCWKQVALGGIVNGDD